MQFLVITKPRPDFATGGLPEDFFELEEHERARARELYGEGHLREVWALVPEGRGAACLFEAESPEAMRELWETFPLVQAGYTAHEIHQLAPYPGLAGAGR